jgi:hypothetical protein
MSVCGPCGPHGSVYRRQNYQPDLTTYPAGVTGPDWHLQAPVGRGPRSVPSSHHPRGRLFPSASAPGALGTLLPGSNFIAGAPVPSSAQPLDGCLRTLPNTSTETLPSDDHVTLGTPWRSHHRPVTTGSVGQRDTVRAHLLRRSSARVSGAPRLSANRVGARGAPVASLEPETRGPSRAQRGRAGVRTRRIVLDQTSPAVEHVRAAGISSSPSIEPDQWNRQDRDESADPAPHPPPSRRVSRAGHRYIADP